MIDHWMTTGLLGANASFQRAAREYAEEYAAMAVAAERERCAKLCEGMHDEDRPSDYAWAIRTDWADEPQSAVAAAFGNINGRPGA